MSQIRVADEADAQAISALVIRSLRESNAGDYHPDHIAALVAGFSPDGVRERMNGRTTFVAVLNSAIAGTASLGDGRVHTVFISPDLQKQGIGAALMAQVEALAKSRAIALLTVRSSITAEGFYQKLGYRPVREEVSGLERTIIMEKALAR